MEKAQRTIRIKWVRSGIGFNRRQKEMVRSLGLRRLNEVVERPDSPQVRGLVSNIPHLVEIVEAPPSSPWGSVPEYTIRPREAAPEQAPPVSMKASEERPARPSKVEEIPAEAAVETQAPSPEPAKAKKLVRPAAAERSKAAARTKKKAKDKQEKAKAARPSKKGKK